MAVILLIMSLRMDIWVLALINLRFLCLILLLGEMQQVKKKVRYAHCRKLKALAIIKPYADFEKHPDDNNFAKRVVQTILFAFNRYIVTALNLFLSHNLF